MNKPHLSTPMADLPGVWLAGDRLVCQVLKVRGAPSSCKQPTVPPRLQLSAACGAENL